MQKFLGYHVLYLKLQLIKHIQSTSTLSSLYSTSNISWGCQTCIADLTLGIETVVQYEALEKNIVFNRWIMYLITAAKEHMYHYYSTDH